MGISLAFLPVGDAFLPPTPVTGIWANWTRTDNVFSKFWKTQNPTPASAAEAVNREFVYIETEESSSLLLLLSNQGLTAEHARI